MYHNSEITVSQGQPMKLLHSAATRLVEDRIPDGAYLGLVQFSTEASILKNLTKVDNHTRIELSRSLPAKDDGGRTAIGKGLQEAIKVNIFYLVKCLYYL